jgi:hypothetical protein
MNRGFRAKKEVEEEGREDAEWEEKEELDLDKRVS